SLLTAGRVPVSEQACAAALIHPLCIRDGRPDAHSGREPPPAAPGSPSPSARPRHEGAQPGAAAIGWAALVDSLPVMMDSVAYLSRLMPPSAPVARGRR